MVNIVKSLEDILKTGKEKVENQDPKKDLSSDEFEPNPNWYHDIVNDLEDMGPEGVKLDDEQSERRLRQYHPEEFNDLPWEERPDDYDPLDPTTRRENAERAMMQKQMEESEENMDKDSATLQKLQNMFGGDDEDDESEFLGESGEIIFGLDSVEDLKKIDPNMGDLYERAGVQTVIYVTPKHYWNEEGCMCDQHLGAYDKIPYECEMEGTYASPDSEIVTMAKLQSLGLEHNQEFEDYIKSSQE